MIGIYRIYHKKSGKSYIGQSVNIKRRIKAHFTAWDKNMYVDRAIRKHGKDAFDWETLEICSEEILNDRECHWIAALDTIKPNGYNLMTGGNAGRWSETSRQKIKGRIPWNKGKKGVQKGANKGIPKTEEVKRKISNTLKGNVPWNKGKKGVQKAWNKGKKTGKRKNPNQLTLFE